MTLRVTLGALGDPGLDAGRDVSSRLDALARAIAQTRSGLLLLPTHTFVVDDHAARARVRRAVEDRIASRQVTLAFGIVVRPRGADWPVPPPGPLGPADAPRDPWVPIFAYVHHRSRRWLWEGERQRVLRADQGLSPLSRPGRRLAKADGLTLGLVLGPEEHVLGPRVLPGADVTIHLRDADTACVGGAVTREPERLILP